MNKILTKAKRVIHATDFINFKHFYTAIDFFAKNNKITQMLPFYRIPRLDNIEPLDDADRLIAAIKSIPKTKKLPTIAPALEIVLQNDQGLNKKLKQAKIPYKALLLSCLFDELNEIELEQLCPIQTPANITDAKSLKYFRDEFSANKQIFATWKKEPTEGEVLVGRLYAFVSNKEWHFFDLWLNDSTVPAAVYPHS